MANCYYLHSSIKKINYDDLPCEDVDQTGRNATCCVRGSTCMSNGLCQNAGGDGYYSGDCTDPTLEDPVCQIRCGGRAGSQVTYNSTSKLWACCSYNGGQPDCSQSTDEVFPAPGPSSLKALVSLPTKGTATYPTPSVTLNSVPSAYTSYASSSSSSISAGAAAGIGVGAGAGMISIAVAIFFLLFKRRLPPGTNDSTSANSELPQKFRGTEFYELQNSSIIQELHDGRTLPELASRVKQ